MVVSQKPAFHKNTYCNTTRNTQHFFQPSLPVSVANFCRNLHRCLPQLSRQMRRGYCENTSLFWKGGAATQMQYKGTFFFTWQYSSICSELRHQCPRIQFGRFQLKPKKPRWLIKLQRSEFFRNIDKSLIIFRFLRGCYFLSLNGNCFFLSHTSLIIFGYIAGFPILIVH